MNSTDTLSRSGWQSTSDSVKAHELLQSGHYAQAVQLLGRLATDYPGVPALDSLLAETRLRLEVEKHNGRARARLRRPSRNLVVAVALVAVLAGLTWAAISFYTAFVTPSMAEARAAQQQERLVAESRQASAAGDYRRALDLLVELAKLNPQHPAVEGIAAARSDLRLEEQYALAQQQIASDQLAEAQATLTGIRDRAPTYRDVNVLLQKIERVRQLAGLLEKANEAMLAKNWSAAAPALEEARNVSPRENRDSIEADLFEVYLALGIQLVDLSGGRTAELQQAADRFGRALALRPMDQRATLQRGWARRYLDAYEAFGEANWDAAIASLEPLYREQPGYLQGRAAKLLYDANMHSAERLVAEQREELAWQRYYAASQLKGIDTTAAETLATKLAARIAATPAPAVTPAPIAAPTSAPAHAVNLNLAPRAAPAQPTSPPPMPTIIPTATTRPTATATPTPALASYKGKIAFLSNRLGDPEIWVMDADGRNPFRSGDQPGVRAAYERLVAAERFSPDGQGALTVGTVAGEANQQVFIVRGAANQRITSMGGTSYDPVWSPTGRWIAFVSNAMGNDEIFVTSVDAQITNRLTSNTWEWDKHPSWSPNGRQIVFWSNREAGRGQIWLMNDDGSGSINLSRNRYDDRDPVWIK